MENEQKLRLGEKEIQPYRSGRFYSVANEWFFAVRETNDMGPYETKLEAEKQLENYISDLKQFGENKVKQSYLSLI